MIQKTSFLIPMDRCGVWWVNTFHVYGGFKHNVGGVGDFVRVSVRSTRPNNWLGRKSCVRGIIMHTRYRVSKRDGSYIKLRENGVVLLKKRMTPRGKELMGPAISTVRRRRFLLSFSGVLL